MNIVNYSNSTHETCLEQVSLSNKNITELNFFPFEKDKSIKHLYNALKKNTVLHTLRILGGECISSQSADDISNILKINTTLKKLVINANKIDNDDALKILDSLKINDTLEYLDLTNNRLFNHNINSDIYRGLFDVFRKNTNLKILDLTNNKFSFSTFNYLLKFLNINYGLQEIDLGNTFPDKMLKNDLYDESFDKLIINICDFLQNNNRITKLGLSNNFIESHHISKIANSLINNTSLRSLDISQNLIGIGTNEGVSGLAKLIRCNKTLTDIDISINYIHNCDFDKIYYAINNNGSIIKLKMTDNMVSWNTYNDVRLLIERNRQNTKIKNTRLFNQLLNTI